MNSKPTENECFVYIVLPGQTDFVTAGKFVLTTDRRDVPTGKFVYGKSYLENENPVPIDPLELKLVSKTYETTILNGVFGALRDASPTIGAAGSLKSARGKRSLAKSIIYFIRRMIVPERLASAEIQSLLHHAASSIRRWNSNVCKNSLTG